MINKQPLWILFEEYEKNNPPENSNIPTPTRYILFYSKVSQNYGKPHKHWTKEENKNLRIL